ncbi:MAG: hypothetical protein ACP5I3_12140, partial [Thermoproteus sp.]
MNALEIAAMAIVFALFAFAVAGAFMYAPPPRPSLDALYVYWPVNYQALDSRKVDVLVPYTPFLTCYLVNLTAWTATPISNGTAY